MDKHPGYFGLLKWSLAQHGDGTSESPPEMAAEDKAFLDSVIESMTVDEAKRMSDLAETLVKPDTADNVPEKEGALEELMERVESIDNARDLAVLGGLAPLRALLSSEHASLRALSAETIAVCVQNNPKVQDMALRGGVLDDLMKRAAIDTDTNEQCKMFLAVSGFVRHHPASLDAFMAQDGVSLVLDALTSTSPRLARRSLFFLRHLLAADTHHNGRVAAVLATRPAVLATILERAQSDDFDNRENGWHVFVEFLGATTSYRGTDTSTSTSTTGSGAATLALGPPSVDLATTLTDGAGAGAGAGTGTGAAEVVETKAEDAAPEPEIIPLPPVKERIALLRAEPLSIHTAVASRIAAIEAMPADSKANHTDELASCKQLRSQLGA